MATDTYYFTGTCKWAKVHTPSPTYDRKGEEYSLNLYLDDESWKLYDESGLQLKKRSDDDGTFITLRCKTQQVLKDTVVERKVEVLDSDSTPMSELIGNGSNVTCRVAVYDTRMGKGHRLEKVMVNILKPFNESKIVSLDNVVPF